MNIVREEMKCIKSLINVAVEDYNIDREIAGKIICLAHKRGVHFSHEAYKKNPEKFLEFLNSSVNKDYYNGHKVC